ncbi:hypothetical protein HY993_03115 [Candidatus Micrarchaeota archaeon]|nr:hypothetical protein [Candidatus Micrarchaeota archaeon]
MLNELIGVFFSIILFCLPGILLAFFALKNRDYPFLEKLLLGAILSIPLVALLSLLEYLLLGIKLSAVLVIANSLLLILAGVLGLVFYHPGSFTRLKHRVSKKVTDKDDLISFLQRNAAYLALILVLIIAFWARSATSTAFNFFEFDPIYYSHVTDLLVKNGAIPAQTTEVYFPQARVFGSFPLLHYITGSWFLVYQFFSSAPYSKELIVAASQLYPALFGAFMSFFAFLLAKRISNEWIGVVAAALFASTPQLLIKTSAGVSELAPLGLFMAIASFALYYISLQKKDLFLGAILFLVMAFAQLSSAHYVWPFFVLAAVIALQSILAFWGNYLDKDYFLVNVLAVGGAAFGWLASSMSLRTSFLDFPSAVLILLLVLALQAVLYAVNSLSFAKSFVNSQKNRGIALAAVLLVGLVLLFLLPFGARILGFANQAAGIAKAGSPLLKTVQEESATSEGIFFSSFGYLNPNLLLPIGMILLVLYLAADLFLSKQDRNKYAAAFLVVLLGLATLVQSVVTSVIKDLTAGLSADYSSLVDFITHGNLFMLLILAILAVFVHSVLTKKNNDLFLFLLLAVIPVSYIGLNKSKYIVHLAFSLVLAFVLVAVLLLKLVELLNAFFSEDNRKYLRYSGLAIIYLISFFAVMGQATTVQPAMNSLSYSRISSDWLDSYAWMANETANPDMTKENCIKSYGYDCRVLSWWDYGHWTVFFGETQSVLDPGNVYPGFDQEVARSFVDGHPDDLEYTTNYHQATHILVDAQLVQKWGALVFLSGSCSKEQSPLCEVEPEIPRTNYPGQSKYEAEHYFEMLTNQGNCPSTVAPFPMPALKSSLTGATYCLAKDQYFLLDPRTNTFIENYSRKFALAGRDPIDGNNLDNQTAYLFPYSQNQFINTNPDLTYVGIDSRVFYSAFTRLYFFEKLPGTTLAYRSARSEVKIFQITPGTNFKPTAQNESAATEPQQLNETIAIDSSNPSINSTAGASENSTGGLTANSAANSSGNSSASSSANSS